MRKNSAEPDLRASRAVFPMQGDIESSLMDNSSEELITFTHSNMLTAITSEADTLKKDAMTITFTITALTAYADKEMNPPNPEAIPLLDSSLLL